MQSVQWRLRTTQICFRLPFASFRALRLVIVRLMSAPCEHESDVLDHRTHTHTQTHAVLVLLLYMWNNVVIYVWAYTYTHVLSAVVNVNAVASVYEMLALCLRFCCYCFCNSCLQPCLCCFNYCCCCCGCPTIAFNRWVREGEQERGRSSRWRPCAKSFKVQFAHKELSFFCCWLTKAERFNLPALN